MRGNGEGNLGQGNVGRKIRGGVVQEMRGKYMGRGVGGMSEEELTGGAEREIR